MKSNKLSSLTKILLITYLSVVVLLPLISMISQISLDDVTSVLSSSTFKTSLVNSLKTSTISTVISVGLAIVLAMCVVRTKIKFKGLFSAIFALPMLIPSISHGMGLVILFGNNGFLRDLLPRDFTIYGEFGIVLGSVMYSLPVAFLMIQDVFKYEDGSPYEACQVLGIPAIHVFRSITLPYLTKPLISAAFAVFTMTLTDYGVPLMVGGKCTTLSVMMYREVIGMLNFGKGAVIGSLLIIPAVITCLFDRNSLVVNPSRTFSVKKNKLRDVISYIICVISSVALVIPSLVFVAVSFIEKYPVNLSLSLRNIETALNLNLTDYLINSLIISLLVSIVGTVIAIACSYFTSRMKSPLTKIIHLLSTGSLAIPGVVLGLSYVLAFKGSWIYGTLIILVIVNSIHFFSSPYLMMYNTFSKLNSNLESTGEVLGVSRIRIIFDVLLPSSRSTIVEMLTYFFVNSMVTISAVSFLYSTSNKPASLMITQLEGQMQIESAAFVSLSILFINIIIKVIARVIKGGFNEKETVV